MCGYRLQRVWLAQAARVGGSLSCIAAEAVAALFMWGGRDDSSTLWRRVCTARYMRARGSGTCDAQRGGALPVRRHLGNAVNLFAILMDAFRTLRWGQRRAHQLHRRTDASALDCSRVLLCGLLLRGVSAAVASRVRSCRACATCGDARLQRLSIPFVRFSICFAGVRAD